VLTAERGAFEEEKRRMTAPSARLCDIVSLNIGGEKFVQRRRSTLCAIEGSLLAARFSGRWEQDTDRDAEGRFFVNTSPELFMPLLDYMGMKEVEDPEHPAPWPEAPEPMRLQFESMLRFFGCIQPEAEDRVLDALKTPYAQVGNRHLGFAFHLNAKSRQGPKRKLTESASLDSNNEKYDEELKQCSRNKSDGCLNEVLNWSSSRLFIWSFVITVVRMCRASVISPKIWGEVSVRFS